MNKRQYELWGQLVDEVRIKIEGLIWSQIWDPVHSQVNNQVDSGVIKDEVANFIWRQIKNPVEVQVGSVRDEILREVFNQAIENNIHGMI